MNAGVVIGCVVIGAIVVGLAIYYGMKATKSSSPTTTSGNSAAVTSALLNPVSATSTASTVTATPLAAPTATATPVVTASPGSSGTPAVSLYSGPNGTGTSETVTTAAQFLSGSVTSPQSATVVNGGSFSVTISSATGAGFSWNVPPGTVGPSNAPSNLSNVSNATAITVTVNGVSQTFNAPANVPQQTGGTAVTTSAPTSTTGTVVVLMPVNGSPTLATGAGTYQLSPTTAWSSLSVGPGFNASMTGSSSFLRIQGPSLTSGKLPTIDSFDSSNDTGWTSLVVTSQ